MGLRTVRLDEDTEKNPETGNKENRLVRVHDTQTGDLDVTR
jgi:hypothetical protein